MQISAENLINLTQATAIANLTDDGIRYYITGEGQPKFPNPVLTLGGRKYYSRVDVAKWNKERNKHKGKNHEKENN